MENLLTSASELVTLERLLSIGSALLKVVIGIILAKLVSRGLGRFFTSQGTTHQAVLVQRIAFYLIAGIFIASALVSLGFDISVLLGAAGILTVAIGFASQTSASNVISGLFLLGERPFAVGDTVRIGTTTGIILSVDLLSVKLRTFDNLFVRVPNESIIKSEITNLTRFPIRRFDILMGVAYKEDLDVVRSVLMETADRNPLCLEEPRPLFIYQGFGDSGLNFQFSVWAKSERFLEMRNTIQIEIKRAFDEANIEIPFPHRALYTSSVTEPFPIRIVTDGPRAEAA